MIDIKKDHKEDTNLENYLGLDWTGCMDKKEGSVFQKPIPSWDVEAIVLGVSEENEAIL